MMDTTTTELGYRVQKALDRENTGTEDQRTEAVLERLRKANGLPTERVLARIHVP